MSCGLLINYAGLPNDISSLFPDNGLALLAANLLQHNHHVKILDFSDLNTIEQIIDSYLREELAWLFERISANDYSEPVLSRFREAEKYAARQEEEFIARQILVIRQMIRQENMNWVGFKLWTNGMEMTARIATAVKESFPEIKIFGGGPNVDIFGKEILVKYPVFDVLCWAEGDHAIVKLADYADGRCALQNIPSIIYRGAEEQIVANPVERIQDLDSLPMPCYDPKVYLNLEEHNKVFIYSVDEARGCPAGCAFCPDPNKYKKKRIAKSAARCFEELCFLSDTCQARAFRFACSNSLIRHMEEIARLIVGNKRKFLFSMFTNTMGLDSDNIRVLKEAGLFGVFVGLESANNAALSQDFKKRMDLTRLASNLQLLKEHEVFIAMSLIHPDLRFREETFASNVDFLSDVLKGYPYASVPF